MIGPMGQQAGWDALLFCRSFSVGGGGGKGKEGQRLKKAATSTTLISLVVELEGKAKRLQAEEEKGGRIGRPSIKNKSTANTERGNPLSSLTFCAEK